MRQATSSDVTELLDALAAATEAGEVNQALLKKARNLITDRGSEKQVEMFRLYERLDRFTRIAEQSSTSGERESADRMIQKAREKLAALTSADES